MAAEKAPYIAPLSVYARQSPPQEIWLSVIDFELPIVENFTTGGADMHRIILPIGLALVLSGCAASGVQVTEQQAQAFQVGRTTYAEVVAGLGEPTSVTSSSKGDRVAIYAYSAVSSRPQNFIPYIGYYVAGYDEKSSAVTFVFDSRGVLKETNSTQNNVGTGVNLAAGSPQGGSNPLMPAR